MPDAIYEFGRFRLDQREHALFHEGRIVALSPKVFEVLLVLLENAGHLVTREELMKRLWPDTFVVDSTLAQNVWLARKALGGGEREDDPIETVPRLGYRFIGAVRNVARRPRAPSLASRCRLLWSRRKLPLKEGENILGRDPDVDVPIEHSTISRRHARILVDGGTATLEDLGSKNGTSHRGKKIQGTVELTDGDSIALGSLFLVFRKVSAPTSTRTARQR